MNNSNKIKKAFKAAFPPITQLKFQKMRTKAGSCFFVTLLNHLYWFGGASIGALFGSFINFNTSGILLILI